MRKDEILTIKELASYFKMTERTIYKMLKKHLVPAAKLSGQWRFKKDIIDNWISEQSLAQSSKIIKTPSIRKKYKRRKKK